MIAFDTNVIARLFIADDTTQTAAARARFERCRSEGTSVYLNAIVLCELVWTLRRTYHFTKVQLLDALHRLLSHPSIVLDDRAVVETAYSAWLTGPADFADYLIAATARERGAATTFTVDLAAAKSPAFTLLQE